MLAHQQCALLQHHGSVPAPALSFTGTKRMLGQLAASLIASASARSFLPRLTKGFACCGSDQPDRVPQLGEFTPPVVGSAAGLERDRQRGEFSEPGEKFAAAEITPVGAVAGGVGCIPGKVKTDLDVSTALWVVSMLDGS